MADEEDTAAMLFRQTGEAVEGAGGVVGTVAIECPQVAV